MNFECYLAFTLRLYHYIRLPRYSAPCVCLSVFQIKSDRRLTFISWEFPFKENWSVSDSWLPGDAAVLMLSKQCPHLYNGAMIYWCHPFHPLLGSLMVRKLSQYYFCHNSRLAAGQPEMDDIWPGVAYTEIFSCDNLVIAVSLFLLSSSLRPRNCGSWCHIFPWYSHHTS